MTYSGKYHKEKLPFKTLQNTNPCIKFISWVGKGREREGNPQPEGKTESSSGSEPVLFSERAMWTNAAQQDNFT